MLEDFLEVKGRGEVVENIRSLPSTPALFEALRINDTALAAEVLDHHTDVITIRKYLPLVANLATVETMEWVRIQLSFKVTTILHACAVGHRTDLMRYFVDRYDVHMDISLIATEIKEVGSAEVLYFLMSRLVQHERVILAREVVRRILALRQVEDAITIDHLTFGQLMQIIRPFYRDRWVRRH